MKEIKTIYYDELSFLQPIIYDHIRTEFPDGLLECKIICGSVGIEQMHRKGHEETVPDDRFKFKIVHDPDLDNSMYHMDPSSVLYVFYGGILVLILSHDSNKIKLHPEVQAYLDELARRTVRPDSLQRHQEYIEMIWVRVNKFLKDSGEGSLNNYLLKMYKDGI